MGVLSDAALVELTTDLSSTLADNFRTLNAIRRLSSNVGRDLPPEAQQQLYGDFAAKILAAHEAKELSDEDFAKRANAIFLFDQSGYIFLQAEIVLFFQIYPLQVYKPFDILLNLCNCPL